jgi:hypothetical protein
VRVAALYNIHRNLPALEAVVDEIRRARPDRVIVDGDVIPGTLAQAPIIAPTKET